MRIIVGGVLAGNAVARQFPVEATEIITPPHCVYPYRDWNNGVCPYAAEGMAVLRAWNGTWGRVYMVKRSQILYYCWLERWNSQLLYYVRGMAPGAPLDARRQCGVQDLGRGAACPEKQPDNHTVNTHTTRKISVPAFRTRNNTIIECV